MIIIHGDNTKASYIRLSSLLDESIKNNHNLVSFDASDLNVTRLEQELSPSDLFGNKSLLLIANLFTGSKSKQKDLIKKTLQEKQDHPIIIYESKEISAATLKAFPGSQIEIFKINPAIFRFLESLSPGNQGVMIQFSSLLSDVESEYIFFMIVRQIRLLISAKSSPGTLKTPSFVKQRLITQANKFGLDQLVHLHHRLYQIDKQVKLGLTPLALEELLVGFLSSL